MDELKEELKTVRRLVQRYAEPEFKVLPTNMPFDDMDDLKKFDEMLPVNDELRVELVGEHKIEFVTSFFFN